MRPGLLIYTLVRKADRSAFGECSGENEEGDGQQLAGEKGRDPSLEGEPSWRWGEEPV